MKYIIDIPDDTTYINALKYEDSKCVAARSYIIPDLTSYTEPDRKAIEDEVWELADNIHRMIIQDKVLCFGFAKTSAVTSNLSYQEAKAKYESWKKQKDEIHIGDEVKGNSGLWTGVVVGFDEFDALIIMDSSGESCGGYKTKFFRKTGRHFDEVEELLKKIRDTE